MSYILFNTESTPVSYPISVANGGTGETTAQGAMIALSSPAFGFSAESLDWGIQPVAAPAAPDLGAIEFSLVELLAALQNIGIIQVV